MMNVAAMTLLLNNRRRNAMIFQRPGAVPALTERRC